MQSDIVGPLQSLLTTILSSFVSYPDDIEITSTEDEQGLLFTVTVHKKDRGVCIGRQGEVAKAVRTILRSAGGKLDTRVSMMIHIPDREFKPRLAEDI